ncbi:LysR substrate-binding domain-containing protein [Streptomyces sp. NPDC005531]|uniref:LysR substrate-binding domain-containing protein n=1 Tax=Streptomyces sp. NPDC005531 TaxID=3364722 RepID=UPI00369385B3
MHIEQMDLNLLKSLDVLLAERHVSRAAARQNLSQPAMSRVLARLRTAFNDELMVRTSTGYELTPRAQALQRELAYLMPRLAALVRSDGFAPATATDTVRIHCTDYFTTVLGPTWFPKLFHQAPRLNIVIEPTSPHTLDDIDRGRVDLALTPIRPPASLCWQTLFQDEFVCLVAADHPLAGRTRLSLGDLARYRRVRVRAVSAEDKPAERLLADLEVHSPIPLTVPYFAAAAAAVPGTTLVAVLPSLFAQRHLERYPGTRIVFGPEEFTPFEYGMIWHPRARVADPVSQATQLG